MGIVGVSMPVSPRAMGTAVGESATGITRSEIARHKNITVIHALPFGMSRSGSYSSVSGDVTIVRSVALPRKPRPAYGTQSILLDAYVPTKEMILQWVNCARRPWDGVTYEVFFGENPSHLASVAKDLNHLEWNVSDLAIAQNYYWQVKATNKRGRSVVGDVQAFSLAPKDKSLYCAPNPFRAGRETTTFSFRMNGAGNALLTVYALPHGEKVAERNWDGLNDMTNRVQYDGMDNEGRPLNNGIYLAVVRMRGSNGSKTEQFKFMVVK